MAINGSSEQQRRTHRETTPSDIFTTGRIKNLGGVVDEYLARDAGTTAEASNDKANHEMTSTEHLGGDKVKPEKTNAVT